MPILHHRTPSVGSYPLWLGARMFVKPLLSVWPLTNAGMSPLYLIDHLADRDREIRGVIRDRVELAGRPAEFILPGGVSRRAHDTAILYLHGGAFVVGGLGTHRAVAARLARRCELPVFSLVYRQLPAAGVGTSVSDALSAYRELVTERGYRHVIVAGDSAGGFLAGKVVEGAAGAGLPRPLAYVGFSPLLDLELGSNPDRSSRSDAYLPKAKMVRLARYFYRGPIAFAGVRRIGALDPEIFPPTFLTTAENEMLEPDAIALVEGLDAAGVPATAHSFSWQVHAFPALVTRHRETLAAIGLAAEFVHQVMAEARRADKKAERPAG
ncbi:MAG: alpha/beta hydrolase [Gordonia sp. (in: high G+C Gram-positive bacteria)]